MTDAGQLWGALPAGLAALGFGYLAGSIPFGLIITRLAGMEDIRAIGSGNIGATNVLRTGRKELAAATLLCDALKGTLAVLVTRYFGGPELAIVAGFGAFIGHLFPVWLKFRGGKGVATFIGLLLAFAWPVVARLSAWCGSRWPISPATHRLPASSPAPRRRCCCGSSAMASRRRCSPCWRWRYGSPTGRISRG